MPSDEGRVDRRRRGHAGATLGLSYEPGPEVDELRRKVGDRCCRLIGRGGVPFAPSQLLPRRVEVQRIDRAVGGGQVVADDAQWFADEAAGRELAATRA